MPIPALLHYFGNTILPDALVTTVAALVPYTIASPYEALLLAVCSCYVPWTFGVAIKSSVTKPDNVNPRKQNAALAATHPAFARCQAAEQNMLESFPYFAAAVLACVQAGVASETVCKYATFWLVARVAFCIMYPLASNAPLSLIRTGTFMAAATCTGNGSNQPDDKSRDGRLRRHLLH